MDPIGADTGGGENLPPEPVSSPRLSSPSVIKDVMSKYGLSFRRSLGQNFLADQNILDKVVSALEPSKEDGVIEIGAGIGTLTVAIAPLCRWLVAIEIDRALIPVLKDITARCRNVKILHADAARIDMRRTMEDTSPTGEGPAPGRKWKVVSNLPYYVTTPIITNILFSRAPVSRVVLMVQKEVAQRMTASPGEEAYGAFTIACQYFSEPRIYSHVPRTAFLPAPDVDSAIVVMEISDRPPCPVEDEEAFFQVVRASFAHRRKTIASALRYTFDRRAVETALDAAGLDGRRRGETFSICEFASLSRRLGTKFAQRRTQC